MNESTPVKTHTARIKGGDGRFLAIRLGRTKMPEPITMPITMAVASTISNRRGRSCLGCDSFFRVNRTILQRIGGCGGQHRPAAAQHAGEQSRSEERRAGKE